MHIFEWRKGRWYRHSVAAVTILAIIVLVSHPELRLLLPLIDAFGLDLFIYLIGSQVVAFVQPLACSLYRLIVRPALRRILSLSLFMFGVSGPYPEAHLVMPGPFRRFAT